MFLDEKSRNFIRKGVDEDVYDRLINKKGKMGTK